MFETTSHSLQSWHLINHWWTIPFFWYFGKQENMSQDPFIFLLTGNVNYASGVSHTHLLAPVSRKKVLMKTCVTYYIFVGNIVEYKWQTVYTIRSRKMCKSESLGGFSNPITLKVLRYSICLWKKVLNMQHVAKLLHSYKI